MFRRSLKTVIAMINEKIISLLLNSDAFTAEEFCKPKKYVAKAATSDRPINNMKIMSFLENFFIESVFLAMGEKNTPHIK